MIQPGWGKLVSKDFFIKWTEERKERKARRECWEVGNWLTN